MKNKTLAKFPNCFLFLIIIFSILFSATSGKGQNNSTVNLSGTVWDTNKYPKVKSNKDNSVTTTTYILGFYNQGKVKIGIIEDKSAGAFEKYEDEDVLLNDGTTENRRVRKLVRTAPSIKDEQFEGTYRIKGKLVYLDFPLLTISATVYSDSIEGVLTHKDTNKEEPLLFTKTTSPNNSSKNISTSNESSKILSNETNKSNPQKVLPQKIFDKFNPTKFTSSTISGNLAGAETEKYFYFTAAPGELTVTLSVTADANSSYNSVMVSLYDPNVESKLYEAGNQFGFLNATTFSGKTGKSANQFKFSEKMPVLVRVKAMNVGTGRFTLRLEGAYEIE